MNKILIVYSALIACGGVFGYLKTGSLPSLVMSSAFASLILASMPIPKNYPALGYKISYGLIGILAAFFTYRLVYTGKFMPSGILAIFSLFTLGTMLYMQRKDEFVCR